MVNALNFRRITVFLFFLIFLSMFFACGQKWSETEKNGIITVLNKDGQTLGYSASSGVSILTVDGYAFKDLNRNGVLDPYEDWRLSPDERARDLASRMSIYQIAGLMLYSGHQQIPGGSIYQGDTYGGKPYDESGAEPSGLSDGQIRFLTRDNLRHVLITIVESPETAARWNNNAQALAEGSGLGIPLNNSSDPRHEAASNDEFTLGAGGEISRWPASIGLAATFDPQIVRRFGEIASIEYRALGLTTALSPQIDLATDPRWYRFKGTFGPHPDMATDMARAYIDGFQTSSKEREIAEGWGLESVNAMVKHWPGGGTGEGGRDAHFGFGKFGVYPGNNLQTHMDVFIKGAFDLNGPTQTASAVMPYYTISWNRDPSGENVGNAFSRYIITDLLRGKYGFDGVVCTDWGVTRDDEGMAVFGATPWGVEHLSEAERHYRIIMAGGDQFGGNNDSGPVIEAYEIGAKKHGEEFMRVRFEQSAVRLLRNMFRVGLFENPYLSVDETIKTVGRSDFMAEGYEAQLKSIVMLKNAGDVLPVNRESRVYIPKRYIPASTDFFGQEIPERWEYPINRELARRYFNVVKDPAQADLAIVMIDSPDNGPTAGYSAEDAEMGGNGFLPVSLRYGAYNATEARDPSLAGDSRDKDIFNRTYRGKTVTAKNTTDLDLVLDTEKLMNDKPVIVVINMSNPTVVKEFEEKIDALLLSFDVQDQALLDIISGDAEPSALLPFQMPADMATVEAQFEDVPLDMKVHIDSGGNAYDFGFGLNWKGVINDYRTERYEAVRNQELEVRK